MLFWRKKHSRAVADIRTALLSGVLDSVIAMNFCVYSSHFFLRE